MPTQNHYDAVVQELKQSGPIAGLWAQCFAEMEADTERAQALYLRRRAEQLEQDQAPAAQEKGHAKLHVGELHVAQDWIFRMIGIAGVIFSIAVILYSSH